MLKDSGNRREFETGAVRDMAEGKGRCDLLPASVLLQISEYRANTRRLNNNVSMSSILEDAMTRLMFYLDGETDNHLCAAACDLLDAMWMEEKQSIDIVKYPLYPACALIRLSKHYENGAKKYAERNWENGLPISSFIDSGIRHLLKYLDGQTDEDHLVAATWNILGAMWMEEKKPELQDIPSRTEINVTMKSTALPSRMREYTSPSNIKSNDGAGWIVWTGWEGNHDRRIEDARCSKCNYVHQTVYGSLSKLSMRCPGCGREMTVNGGDLKNE